MMHRRALLLWMLRGGTLLLSSTWTASIGFGAEIRSVDVERIGARYRLVSETHFDARLQDVFDTLIDYDHLAGISETIKESHYLRAAGDAQPLVFTRIGACLLFYCKSVEKVERLELEAPYHVVATAIPERSDVRSSRSEWSLSTEEGGGTNVVFQLEFEPDFWIPPIIGPFVIRELLIKDGESAVQEIEAMARRRAIPVNTADR